MYYALLIYFLSFQQHQHDTDQGMDFGSTLPPLRRAKSLDRRTTESVMTVSFIYVLYLFSHLTLFNFSMI